METELERLRTEIRAFKVKRERRVMLRQKRSSVMRGYPYCMFDLYTEWWADLRVRFRELEEK